ASTSLTFVPDHAAQISALSLQSSTIVVATTTLLSGQALDQFGNNAPAGEAVALSITNGNGSFAPNPTLTLADGSFTSTLTAGTHTADPYTVETITATAPTGL